MKQPDYKFYPSLLDAFQSYLDCEANYERFYGMSDEPSVAFADYEQKTKQELIDKINRVPFDSEAADKGTCFNEIVDCLILRTKSTRDDVQISSQSAFLEREVYGSVNPWDGKAEGDVEEQVVQMPHIEAVKGERVFRFDIDFCKNAARYFRDSIPQLYTEATIHTDLGTVMLYGYIDYLRADKVYDAKTTKKYEFGKYQKYWQRHVYPWTLIESGKCTTISSFEFTAFQLKGGTSKQPIITGDMFPEVYVYNHDVSTQRLKEISTQFIEFLENNRSLITDEKVFGGEKN